MFTEEPKASEGVYKGNSYYEVDALSNSKLSTILTPHIFFSKSEKLESRALLIGSLVDCLLTSPEDFDKLYYMSNSKRPYGKLGKFIEKLAELGEITEESLSEAYTEAGYQISPKAVNKIFYSSPDNLDYYAALRNSEGKTVITEDEYKIAFKCIDSIRRSEWSKIYFEKPLEIEGKELLHQIPIYFRYGDRDCKSLLDGILIDHDKRTIQPFDLKTTGSDVYEFEKSMLTFGYYRQAAFYRLALLYNAIQNENYLAKLMKQRYKLLPFRFVVVQTTPNVDAPSVVYEVSERDLECGLKGCDCDGKHYYGIDELIALVEWHEANREYVLPKKLVEASGVLKTQIF